MLSKTRILSFALSANEGSIPRISLEHRGCAFSRSRGSLITAKSANPSIVGITNLRITIELVEGSDPTNPSTSLRQPLKKRTKNQSRNQVEMMPLVRRSFEITSVEACDEIVVESSKDEGAAEFIKFLFTCQKINRFCKNCREAQKKMSSHLSQMRVQIYSKDSDLLNQLFDLIE